MNSEESLSRLPHFLIEKVDTSDGTVLSGVLDSSRGVKLGRAWLYRPHDESVEGDLVQFDRSTGHAVMRLAPMLPEVTQDPLRPWDRIPYFYGWWEPRDIELVLDDTHQWVRVEDVPANADAVCQLCLQHIGPRYQHAGYRRTVDLDRGLNSGGPWICEYDYHHAIANHDLDFLAKVEPYDWRRRPLWVVLGAAVLVLLIAGSASFLGVVATSVLALAAVFVYSLFDHFSQRRS